MNGRSSNDLDSVLWTDGQIESVSIDYEKIILEIKDGNGQFKLIHCDGYIGYICPGFWDEVIIERAQLSKFSEFQYKCIARLEGIYGRDLRESGSRARNSRTFETLRICFIDGTDILIVASEFRVATQKDVAA